MIKRFLEWIGIKQNLEKRSEKKYTFKEGEIWWVAVGENIGVEVNGKGNAFSRPVVIYKKFSKESFLGISLSTQVKTGSWYVSFDFKDDVICANVSQIKTMSVRRLYEKMGEMTSDDFAKVKGGFLRLYS